MMIVVAAIIIGILHVWAVCFSSLIFSHFLFEGLKKHFLMTVVGELLIQVEVLSWK